MAADMAAIQTELGEGNDERAAFTWAGADYPCAATTELAGVIVNISGNPTEATLGLLVRHEDFAERRLPGSGAQFTWNGRPYKLARVRDLHGAGAWLYCVDGKAK